ncbi:MAG: trigger factor [Sphingomonadales bacterium]|nr:trigger factor [Sphingomonadales bacterium]
MQIVETSNEGLKRAYTVTIPAKTIADRIEGEVVKMAPQVRMPGFRPGKVPANLLKKMHGPALHQEALNTAIREAMDKLVVDQQLRPATQPSVALGEGYEEGKDAEIAVELEVLPVITTPDLSGIKLEKLVVPVKDEEVDEAVKRIASSAKSFDDAPEGKAAADGDQIVVDFTGKLNGVEFEGGKAEDAAIEIGAGRFIPGFEEQLTGVVVGEERTITVTFPADYPAENLKGQEAQFDVVVKAVKVAGEAVIDDEFAKKLGLPDLETLRNLMKGQLEQETGGQTRTAMKRSLLDQLAAGHDFEVPPSMVEAEFAQIWEQLTQEAGHEEDPEAAMKEIEAEKDDYRAIAVRRVRLGLLLSDIGQANGVDITAQEMNMLVNQAAQQYRPEDRQRFMEYVQNEPMFAAQLRAPLYEEKVVDFLFEKADVTEREVTKEELQAAIEAEEGHVHGPNCGHDHGEEKPKKKAAAKKKPADEAPAAEAAAEEAPVETKAKKPAARKKAEPAAEAAEEAPAEKPKKAPAKKKAPAAE